MSRKTMRLTRQAQMARVVIAAVVGLVATQHAYGQNCGSYKSQLEALLVLPAGKYKVDEFRATTEQKAITLKSGATAWLDGIGNIKNSPEPNKQVVVSTYLEYQLPRSPLKVADSVTNGRRLANGRLSCTYLLSYPPLNRQRSQEVDVQISDGGRVRFFVPTLVGALLAGDDPNGYAPITSELGAGIALNLIATGLRERDKNHLALQTNARQSYAEILAKAQAKQDEDRPKYLQKISECKRVLNKALYEYGNKETHGWKSPEEKLDYYDMMFDNTGCSFTSLPRPSIWIRGGAKPFDSQESVPSSEVKPDTPAEVAEITTHTPKSPKTACRKQDNFIALALCMAVACGQPEYQGHADCPKAQPQGDTF